RKTERDRRRSPRAGTPPSSQTAPAPRPSSGVRRERWRRPLPAAPARPPAPGRDRRTGGCGPPRRRLLSGQPSRHRLPAHVAADRAQGRLEAVATGAAQPGVAEAAVAGAVEQEGEDLDAGVEARAFRDLDVLDVDQLDGL